MMEHRLIVNYRAGEAGDRECTPRYGVEHILLPEVLYAAGDAFFCDILLNGSKSVAELYGAVYDVDGEESPVKASDFVVAPKLYDVEGDRCVMLRITMPEPTAQLECRDVYLCYSPKNKEYFYFTSERSTEGPYFLCGWTKEKVHLNFGIYEGTDEEEAVLRFFKELIMDGGLDKILRAAG